MKIAGINKNSTIDYPGNLSAVVFTQGCNMNCGYCHNRQLIGYTDTSNTVEEESVFAFLKIRRGLLDGVVVSGGEPTLQKDLGKFLEIVKAMGFKTKLDTNGTNPDCLKELLNKGLLDYVAMDIKAPLSKYKMVCRSPVNIENLSRSVELIKSGLVEYEFRTTYVPELCGEDLLDILSTIKGADKCILQQYKEVDIRDGKYTGRIEKRNILKDIVREFIKGVNTLQFRGEFEFV